MIEINNIKYEIIKDENEGFDEEALIKRYSEYFEIYDYILGDWAYGKLRLKGFTKKNNKAHKPINDYAKIDEYIKNSCAFGCKYFILEKK